jgi:hypothetical protein
MQADFAVAPDGFSAALVSQDPATVNSSGSISQVDIFAPECCGLAWPGTLPKLKECKLVVVRSLRAKSRENDFPLFRGVGINAGIGYGEWLKERAVIKIGFHQAVDSRIPEHRSQTAVNDAINAAGFAAPPLAGLGDSILSFRSAF